MKTFLLFLIPIKIFRFARKNTIFRLIKNINFIGDKKLIQYRKRDYLDAWNSLLNFIDKFEFGILLGWRQSRGIGNGGLRSRNPQFQVERNKQRIKFCMSVQKLWWVCNMQCCFSFFLFLQTFLTFHGCKKFIIIIWSR